MITRLLRKFAPLLCLVAVSGTDFARAQTYPTRPIEVIVPFAAGANSDLAARAVAEAYAKAIGAMIVTNKDGAAGIIGTAAVASARPDGYTLGFSTMGPISAQPHLHDNLRYDASSFEYICQVTEVFVVLSVPNDSSHKTLSDLLAYAKSNPDRLTYGHPGAGSVPHLLMQDLAARVGVGIAGVPFRGDAQALNSLLGNHIDSLVSGDAVVLGKGIRPLAVFANKRLPHLPDVPTTQELGLGPGLGTPAGLFAPKGLSKDVVAKLRQVCAAAVRSDEVADAMKNTRQNLTYLDGSEFSRRVERDSSAIAGIIKLVGRPKN